jgi:hypothetical protein
MFVDLRGAPFGHSFLRDHNLWVPVFFEQNHIRTIGQSTFWRTRVGWQQRVRWFARINSQKMRELGATPRGMQLLLDHEAQATAAALDTERQTRRSTRHSIQVLT